MPRLSDTMTEGVISNWLKHEGDLVQRGEILAEIETDKAMMELESYDTGVLSQILVEPGRAVPVGTPIAIIGDQLGSPPPSTDAVQPNPLTTVEASPAPSASLSAVSSPPAATSTGPLLRATPLVRRLAREHGIDLAAISGSGPRGRIVRADLDPVLATRSSAPPPQRHASALSQETAATPPDTPRRIELSSVKRLTAHRMSQSAQVPQFSLTSAVDAAALLELRSRLNEQWTQQETRISVNDLLLRAVGLALRAHPEVNSSWGQDHLIEHAQVNVGYAVATQSGLIVAVVRDTDQKNLSTIAVQSRDLTARARAGRLTVAETSGGTFTISNLGMFNVEHFTALVNPPEAAILSVGAAREEAVVRDGQVRVTSTIRLTLTSDHRVLDGAQAAIFLRDVVMTLEQPLRLLE